MGDFKRLIVWRRARALVGEVYRATLTFPSTERFGLTSQLRRAAVSVAANIAEGAGKKNDREFARFLRIARGSIHEVECELILASDLGFIDSSTTHALLLAAREVSQMLNRLIATRVLTP